MRTEGCCEKFIILRLSIAHVAFIISSDPVRPRETYDEGSHSEQKRVLYTVTCPRGVQKVDSLVLLSYYPCNQFVLNAKKLKVPNESF